MNINFKNFSLEIFGSSHANEIGVNIDGFPKGIKIDNKYIKEMMERRRPGKSKLTTLRNEADAVLIKSGIEKGITNGHVITGVIENTNRKSKDYKDV